MPARARIPMADQCASSSAAPCSPSSCSRRRSPPPRRRLLLPAPRAPPTAAAAPRPPLFQTGRYAALGPGGSLSFVVSRQQITRLQVRMPLACQDKRTHAHTAPTLAFAASTGKGRANTYSRIYLPADGATNVSFVVDDNRR